MKQRPLTGIRVIDLSRVLAGPYCGQLLADMGADVVKVEAPTGDENRKWAPKGPSGESCSFLSVNRGKRGMTLNLQSESGHGLLLQMLAKADVLIHNYLPGTAQRLGIDPDDLLQRFPRLIVCSVTAYGAEGPWRDKPGYDGVVQAFSGIMGITGEANGGPVRVGPSVVDMSTGLIAYGGVTTALLGRASGTGERHVQASLLESAISLLGFHAVAWLQSGILPRREGSALWNLVPYQAFKCSDGYLMTGALNDGTWLRLCDAVGRGDLRDNPQFATTGSRLNHRAYLVGEFETIFATATAAEWTARLENAGVAVSPINTLEQTFEHEQTIANRMVVPVTCSDGAAMKLLGLPFKLGTDTAPSPLPPPRLAEHTDEILSDWLGLTSESITGLMSAGAF